MSLGSMSEKPNSLHSCALKWVGCRLSADLSLQLKLYCVKNGISMQELLKEIIIEKLQKTQNDEKHESKKE